MSIAGTWDLTIKAPTGAMKTVLEVKETDGGFSGVQSGQGVATEIPAIKVVGSDVSWSSEITRPMKMKLEFAGTLEGDTLNGKVKAGMMGKYPFTATKV